MDPEKGDSAGGAGDGGANEDGTSSPGSRFKVESPPVAPGSPAELPLPPVAEDETLAANGGDGEKPAVPAIELPDGETRRK